MGFLDNFKQAMQNGANAANAHIERERAKQAASAPTARTAAGRPVSARPAVSSRHTLPEGVIMVDLEKLSQMNLGVNANGQQVILNIRGTMRAKPMGQTSLDADGQREEIRAIAQSVIFRELAPNINSMSDVKFLMTSANRISKVIVEEVKGRGYQSIFQLPLIIRPL